jgi:hypothetical protein
MSEGQEKEGIRIGRRAEELAMGHVRQIKINLSAKEVEEGSKSRNKKSVIP